MWALPLIRYTAGIINWSLCELKQLEISTWLLCKNALILMMM